MYTSCDWFDLSCVISIACSGISADGPVYPKKTARTMCLFVAQRTLSVPSMNLNSQPAGAFDRSIVFASNGTVTVFWKRSSSDRFRGMDAVFHIQPRSSDLHVYPSSPLLDRAGQNRPFRACSGNLQCVSTGLVDRHTAFGGRVGCRHCPARPAVPGLYAGRRAAAAMGANSGAGLGRHAAGSGAVQPANHRHLTDRGDSDDPGSDPPSSRGLTRRNVPAWPSSCYRFALRT